MHNGLRKQQRSDSAPVDVWHKILFTSVGTIFLKIYNLIPNGSHGFTNHIHLMEQGVYGDT